MKRVISVLICLIVFSAQVSAARGGKMDATFENNYLKLTIGSDGKALHFIDRKTGSDYCKPGTPFARVARAGKEYPATAASREGDLLRLSFGDSGIEANVKITSRGDYFVAEVVSLTSPPTPPGHSNGMREANPLDSQEREGGTAAQVDTFVTIDIQLKLKGSIDEPFSGCVLALDLQSNIEAWPGPCSRLLATTYSKFGFKGAETAIIGCPPGKMRGILQQAISAAPDMPHSALGGPWAMDAPEARGSYLFNFDGITEANADKWIALAKALGMTQIDFHGGSSFRFGDCRPNPATYPNGFADLKAAIDKLHAAGIRAGLHTYAFMIAKDCPWVTNADPRLRWDKSFTLSDALSETDTTVKVDESTKDISTVTGFFVRNSITIRIDNELINFSGVSDEGSSGNSVAGRFTGCTRGAYGTKVASHAKGAKAYHLLECFGLFAPDGEATLLAEVAQKTADAFNECGFDNIYLDALDAEDVAGGPEWGWHYGSKFAWEICKRLKKPALMEMSTFHHHLWCIRSRMGAWDHPSRSHKQFIDNHVAANNLNAKIFLPSQLGWWAIKAWNGAQGEPTTPDVMEYLLCKALANDTGYALMGINPDNYAVSQFMQRLAPISKRYEELRLSGRVPEPIKAKLREPGKEFRLETQPNGDWQFRPIRYDRHKAESAETMWQVKSDFSKQPLKLRIEALLSAGPYDAPDNVMIADFVNPSALPTRHSPPSITADLTASTDQAKAGQASGCFTATSKRSSRSGAWTMVEKTFTPPLDLSKQQGMGVWIYGDGQGEILNFQVQSPHHISDAMAGHYVTVDFTGWRYFELIEPEAERFRNYVWPFNRPKLEWDKEEDSADRAAQHWVAGQYGIYRESVSYGQVGSLSIWYNNLPPGKTVKTYISPVKALPLVTQKLVNPSITIGGKTLRFAIEMESGSYLEFNSTDDCKVYDKEGVLIGDLKPTGDVPDVAKGENEVRFSATAGDVNPRAYVTVITEGEPLAETYSTIVAPSTAEHPRNGEADMIRLKNGDLFLAYGRWDNSTSDFGTAEVWCKTSSDKGRTWKNDRALVPNEGKLTTFSVSLLRMKNGEILMSYLTKDNHEDCNIFFRTSTDEGKTWSPRRKFEPPAPSSGYTAMNNARLVLLKSGRVLAAAWAHGANKAPIVGFTLYSDDNGQTWRKSTEVDMRTIDLDNKVGAQEPNVIELKDGRIMMLIRNSLGCICRCYSSDQGETWSKIERIPELVAPVAPSSIIRLPQTSDLLLVWNRNPKDRRPLNSAISRDEGKTWEHIRVVDDGLGFAYTSITPVDDEVVLTYWQYEAKSPEWKLSLKLKAIPYTWFYGEDKGSEGDASK